MAFDQKHLSQQNQIAWNQAAYDAWVKRYGEPEAAALEICDNPEHIARRILQHLAEVSGMKIANPLGSHGRLAVALSKLGADVTVFDISKSNAEYGNALAKAARTSVSYKVGDFLELANAHSDRHDYVVMELGILHYFLDLKDFANAVSALLKPDGKMVLVDFHPLERKAIKATGEKLELIGSYFHAATQEAPTPYDVFLDQAVAPCLIRRWRLDEILNAFIKAGFLIEYFQEHPSPDCPSLPGTFTLVAKSAV